MQPYHSLSAFQIAHPGRILPGWRKWPWRLTQAAPIGEVNGLPRLRGRAVATNGILVALENPQGDLMFCHYDWFVADSGEPIEPKPGLGQPTTKRLRLTTEQIDKLIE